MGEKCRFITTSRGRATGRDGGWTYSSRGNGSTTGAEPQGPNAAGRGRGPLQLTVPARGASLNNMERMSARRKRLLLCLSLLAAAVVCGPTSQAPPLSRPNVLWIVWDTVRADRFTLYGFPKETTPFVEKWAADALVFDNCVSTANYTLPSHASMFTGLLPSEHGAHNDYAFLDDGFTTIAELFRDAGYETYLFSANPRAGSAAGTSRQAARLSKTPSWSGSRRTGIARNRTSSS